jgi:hypothetical protein
MTKNQLSNASVNCAVEVHRPLDGPGLREQVYKDALALVHAFCMKTFIVW